MSARSRFTSEQKVKILREYLENGVSVSLLSEQYKIHPNVIYKWKNDLFEGALKTFSGEHKNKKNREEIKIKQLEEKLKARYSLITEVVSENIQLKRTFGGVCKEFCVNDKYKKEREGYSPCRGIVKKSGNFLFSKKLKIILIKTQKGNTQHEVDTGDDRTVSSRYVSNKNIRRPYRQRRSNKKRLTFRDSPFF